MGFCIGASGMAGRVEIPKRQLGGEGALARSGTSGHHDQRWRRRDVYGDGVNVCSRLLEYAKPHGVVMSEAVHALVKPRLPMAARSLGRLKLKDVSDKIAAYHLWFRSAPRRGEAASTDALKPALPTGDWYCPRCGYNLRGRPAGCCSECAWEFDEALRTVSLLPWNYRKDIGRLNAFVQTTWIATFHPSRLAAEAHRPVTFSDASAYFRVVAAIVVLAAVVMLGLTTLQSMMRGGVPRDIVPIAVAGDVMLGIMMGGVLLLGAACVLLVFRAPGPKPRHAESPGGGRAVDRGAAVVAVHSCAGLGTTFDGRPNSAHHTGDGAGGDCAAGDRGVSRADAGASVPGSG